MPLQPACVEYNGRVRRLRIAQKCISAVGVGPVVGIPLWPPPLPTCLPACLRADGGCYHLSLRFAVGSAAAGRRGGEAAGRGEVAAGACCLPCPALLAPQVPMRPDTNRRDAF